MPSTPPPRWPLAALLALLAAAPTLAQTGTVAGVVVDRQTGETLIGVNIVVGSTEPVGVGAMQLGTTTDLDGRYQLRLDAGTYTLVYSYVGYDTQTVENVRVAAGQAVSLDLALSPAALGLGEVVVQAEAVMSDEAGLLRVQARAPSIMDGISAQQIRRSPDANSGEALRRVTGVTVASGKFVYVRGLPERYSGTLLNGSPVPSTEPDRRAFAYDLIPSNLLESVLVAKSATPDLPGDFAGGLLQLQTVDFPERPTVGVSVSSGVSNATGAALLTAPRGGTDFLGIDDGTRAIPGGLPEGNLSGPAYSNADRAAFGQMFNNGWALDSRDGPVTPNFALSAGGATEGRLGRLGAVGAITYRSGYALSDLVRRDYEDVGLFQFDYAGSQYVYNVSWGGIFNVAYRPSRYHSLSLRNFYTRTADDEVTQLFGREYTAGDMEEQQTAIRFVSRDVYSGQLIGEHFFERLGGLQLRWDASRAYTTRDEPDYRRVVYSRPADAPEDTPFRLVVGPTVSIKNGGRFFSELQEDTYSGALRASLPMGQARLTAGTFASRADRSFSSRLLAVITPRRDFDNSLLALPLGEVFRAENFGRLYRPGCENGGRRCEGFLLGESQTGSKDYDAGQAVTAAFAMVDAPLAVLSERLRLVGGVRLERAVQRVESSRFGGDTISTRNPYLDVLPSFNLTYALSERTNLRAAYSRNVNRPELRELAPFAYYDFELQTTVYGNDTLRQARLNNFDLRIETYPGAGQMLSASLFYKHFQDPIERVIVPGVALSKERTFQNAEFAANYGFELEARYGLGFLLPYLRESSVVANYTWIDSDVEVLATELSLPRSGRPLQGQSAYVINAGLNFVEPRFRTAVSVLYNRLGSRVVEAAAASDQDVVEMPRDLVDLSITQPLLDRYELRFAMRDVLHQPQQFFQEGELIRENLRGRSFSFGVSARF